MLVRKYSQQIFTGDAGADASPRVCVLRRFDTLGGSFFRLLLLFCPVGLKRRTHGFARHHEYDEVLIQPFVIAKVVRLKLLLI